MYFFTSADLSHYSVYKALRYTCQNINNL